MTSPFSVFNWRGVEVDVVDEAEVGGNGDVSDATMDATVLALDDIGVVDVVDVVVVGVPANDEDMTVDEDDGESAPLFWNEKLNGACMPPKN